VAGQAWERGAVPLKFQLGDIILGSGALSLFRRSAGLDEPPLDIGDTPEPPPRLDGADGYVVWSQPIVRKWPVLSARRDAMLYVPRQYRRFSADLSGSFAQYMSAFSSKTRSGLKRKMRKVVAASDGSIDWRVYWTPEEMDQFFQLAKPLSAKTYQERYLKIGLPTDRDFIRSAKESAREDNLRAYLLFLNGEPISYLYCPVKQGVVIYQYLGYHPAHASLSPGTVLQMLALEALFAEQRFTMFDFTEGEGQHKATFSTSSLLCGDVYVINRRFAPLSMVMLHWAFDSASATIGKVLERANLKSRLRRLIRKI
jgi:hypothetical protein